MNLTLRRTSETQRGTFGMLLDGDTKLCVTCEEPWNDNERLISCIPSGTYEVVRRESPKYGHHWHVLDVPDRDMILIHIGNTIKDTSGCILVGTDYARDTLMNITGITQSVKAMKMLRDTLRDRFTLTIEAVP